MSKVHACEQCRFALLCFFSRTALITHALECCGDREPDDEDADDEKPHDDDERNGEAEQAQEHPSKRPSAVAPVIHEREGIEDDVGIDLSIGHEHRKQREQRKEDDERSKCRTRGNKACIETEQISDRNYQEEEWQHIGPDAESIMKPRSQQGGDHAIRRKQSGDEQRHGKYREHHPGDIVFCA